MAITPFFRVVYIVFNPDATLERKCASYYYNLTANVNMNAKDINIGGVIFHIEENGFPVLEKFLDGINSKAFFSGKKPKELENEITEIFLSMLSKTKLTLKLRDIYEMIELIDLNSQYEKLEAVQIQRTKLRSQILEIAYQQLGFTKSFYY